MPTTPFHTELAVPVAGGALTVGVAGPGAPGAAPVVLGLHGTTGSHRALAAVARHLAARNITILVPDHWGAERAVLAGHSLGAWVAARAAAAHPERSAGVVLVDGGLSRRLSGGIDPDAVIDSVLGPALVRL